MKVPHLVVLIWAAGGVQLAILAANFVLPGKLRCRESLARASPMIRHMFIVHWIYLVAMLGISSSNCFGFATDLAGGSRLGRFLSKDLRCSR